MYKKTDKRRIYWLINLYLSGKISPWDFCNEYYGCYDLEIDRDTLTSLEIKAFSELSVVAGRFSNFQEDIEKYPGVYFTEEQLRQKVIETKELLSDYFLQLKEPEIKLQNLVIEFILNSQKKISITVPDLPEKINYYRKPTNELHKFDVVTVLFITDGHRIQLIEESLDFIVGSLYSVLIKAINNKSKLSVGLQVGNIGIVLNNNLNKITNIDLSQFWIFSSQEGIQTLIYNTDDKIYLEIAQTYPWFFRDPELGEDFITFEQFMKNYKPYVIEVIPKDIAIGWKKQCEYLLKNIDSTYKNEV